jgi:vitamin B12 transporter
MQTRLATVVILMGTLIGMTTGLWAEEAPEEATAEAVVVTATKTETPITEVASSVYVIDSKTIEDKKATTVLEVLRDAPGLQVVQSGGLGGQTSVFLRGGNSDYTLVLIDGVRVNDPTNGSFDFANLTTDNIERIEVIYGPQSTLYGSDAVGGVIQIITKKGKGTPHGYVFGEGGSFGTFRQGGGFSGDTGPLDYSFEASHIKTNGISKADARPKFSTAGNSERDGYDNLALSSRIGMKFLEDGRIDLATRFLLSQTALDGSDPFTGLPVDDPNLEQLSRQLTSSIVVTKRITDWWQPRIEISLNANTVKDHDPINPFVQTDPHEPYDGCISLGYVCVNNNSSTITHQRFADWQNTFNIAPSEVIVAGYEYYRQEGSIRTFASSFTSSQPGATTGFDITNGNHALYFQLQHDIAKQFFATTGIRHEMNTHFGEKTTYKLDLAYLLPVLESKIHANYGTGFHAPTMNDLFFPGFSNKNLKPENSESYEIGFSLSPIKNVLSMGATYFYNNYTNLIAFDPLLFIPVNVARARSQGVSLDATATPIREVSLKANYTYLWAENLDAKQDLLRRPHNKVNILLDVVPIDRLHINTDIQYVSSRADFDGRVGAYALVGVAVTYDVMKHVQVYAKIDNLLDRDYEEINGYGTVGRSVYGGARVSF